MKKMECYIQELSKFEKYRNKHFNMEIIYDKDEYELWLSHPEYSIKLFIYGAKIKDFVINWDILLCCIDEYKIRFVD